MTDNTNDLADLGHVEGSAHVEGLGDPQATLRVYLANRPSLEPFTDPGGILPLAVGDIAQINSHEGNHWRKIFNVYAKFLAELKFPGTEGFSKWQDYRDNLMLQPGSNVALIFSQPDLTTLATDETHLFMGKQFAQDCGFFDTDGAQWLTKEFAVNSAGWMVCPYFDYRQLSDEKIRFLVSRISMPWQNLPK